MNTETSNVIAGGFMKGVCSVMDAMLSVSLLSDIVDMKDLEDGELTDYVQQFPVGMYAKLTAGGAAALLFPEELAATFVALVQGEETAKTSIEPDDMSVLQEIADPCLGGGTSHLKEKFERDIEPDGGVTLAVHDDALVTTLQDLFADGTTAAEFTLKCEPQIDHKGVLLFSQALEPLVPQALVQALFGDEAADTELSEDEVNDILSDFGDVVPDAEIPMKAGGASVRNLDLILDIKLDVTVRLGRVDMPLGEILELGPGSLIDVGHIVEEPVELLVNDKLLARGDVVVVDEKFGLRITEVLTPEERIARLQ